ncbi:RNA-binding domain-containing protein [Seminibacterium arietis]|uniref:RNA-binding domain-containing protein n=1 Tax=Seminibacterium arietis TaxID=1173502 RepID=A0ABW3I878_9PAST
MKTEELQQLLKSLVNQPNESEWLEFKLNYHSDAEIGQRISALSNAACIHQQNYAYLVFGVEDKTHNIIGTHFKPKSAKAKGEKRKDSKEELENWLAQRLNPRVDFTIEEFEYEDKPISLFKIPATYNQPVEFSHTAYIRVGSYTRKLNEFPEKARKIWKNSTNNIFEERIAQENLQPDQIIELLDTQSYFELMKIPYPSNRKGVLEKFCSEKFILLNTDGRYNITNLGALLFAKDLNYFEQLKRKAVRVIVYESKNKLNTVREVIENKGYAVGFKNLIAWINGQLPSNEIIGQALREEIRMYPEIAIRELIANALIHQDFNEKGFPMVEIFSDRIEISNAGLPLIVPDRFIDEYQSRNEKLADVLRRARICEEKGSGIDKVISWVEAFQLPAPNFIVQNKHTKTILYAHQALNRMSKKDKIRATYQHCCLCYVNNEKMTNQSLRERFKIDDRNSAIVSRIISETLSENLIKNDDPDAKSKKYAKYIPYWA